MSDEQIEPMRLGVVERIETEILRQPHFPQYVIPAGLDFAIEVALEQAKGQDYATDRSEWCHDRPVTLGLLRGIATLTATLTAKDAEIKALVTLIGRLIDDEPLTWSREGLDDECFFCGADVQTTGRSLWRRFADHESDCAWVAARAILTPPTPKEGPVSDGMTYEEARAEASEEERQYREVFLPEMVSRFEEELNRRLSGLLPEGCTVQFDVEVGGSKS
jgi:hypothetical protein